MSSQHDAAAPAASAHLALAGPQWMGRTSHESRASGELSRVVRVAGGAAPPLQPLPPFAPPRSTSPALASGRAQTPSPSPDSAARLQAPAPLQLAPPSPASRVEVDREQTRTARHVDSPTPLTTQRARWGGTDGIASAVQAAIGTDRDGAGALTARHGAMTARHALGAATASAGAAAISEPKPAADDEAEEAQYRVLAMQRARVAARAMLLGPVVLAKQARLRHANRAVCALAILGLTLQIFVLELFEGAGRRQTAATESLKAVISLSSALCVVALWWVHGYRLRLDKLRSKVPYDERMLHMKRLVPYLAEATLLLFHVPPGISWCAESTTDKGNIEWHCIDDLGVILFVRLYTFLPVFRDFYWGGATVRRYTENQVEHTIPFTIRTVMFYHPQKVMLSMCALMVSVFGYMVWAIERKISEPTIPTYSIAIWMTFISFSTTGYGDYSPLSSAGRFVMFLTVCAGVASAAVYTSILFAAMHLSREERLYVRGVRRDRWMEGLRQAAARTIQRTWRERAAYVRAKREIHAEASRLSVEPALLDASVHGGRQMLLRLSTAAHRGAGSRDTPVSPGGLSDAEGADCELARRDGDEAAWLPSSSQVQPAPARRSSLERAARAVRSSMHKLSGVAPAPSDLTGLRRRLVRLQKSHFGRVKRTVASWRASQRRRAQAVAADRPTQDDLLHSLFDELAAYTDITRAELVAVREAVGAEISDAESKRIAAMQAARWRRGSAAGGAMPPPPPPPEAERTAPGGSRRGRTRSTGSDRPVRFSAQTRGPVPPIAIPPAPAPAEAEGDGGPLGRMAMALEALSLQNAALFERLTAIEAALAERSAGGPPPRG